MSCNNCSPEIDNKTDKCTSTSNCTSLSCQKLTVFDWLSNLSSPNIDDSLNLFEVSFKNGRKVFCSNPSNFKISIGDIVAVEASPGHDVGIVSLAGELIKVQMKRKKIPVDSQTIKKIYRIANKKDIDVWHSSQKKEYSIQHRSREIISGLGLKMKLSDVEFQGDGTKATFYYTAEERVDFRQLIRDLAVIFGIRIEMKQVSLRKEAARLGGVGSCGRELCCSTWLTHAQKVNTSSARYQQISLNPQKLAGQCGKLKCCLNYELDTYLDAIKNFPKQNIVLKTEKGDAEFVKMDIFKNLLWYKYTKSGVKWFKLTLNQVNEIIAFNKYNEKVSSLEDYEEELIEDSKTNYEDVVGQDSLNRFDTPKRNKKRNKRKKRNRNFRKK